MIDLLEALVQDRILSGAKWLLPLLLGIWGFKVRQSGDDWGTVLLVLSVIMGLVLAYFWFMYRVLP